jgi:chromosome segregation ATPase
LGIGISKSLHNVDQHEKEIIELKRDLEHKGWEIKLLQSRYESEQRGRIETGKRADQAIKDIDRLKDELKAVTDENKEMRKMVYGDNGFLMRLDRLEQRSSSGKENLRTGLSVGAILLTLWKVVSDYIKR